VHFILASQTASSSSAIFSFFPPTTLLDLSFSPSSAVYISSQDPPFLVHIDCSSSSGPTRFMLTLLLLKTSSSHWSCSPLHEGTGQVNFLPVPVA
jgi:hypothetical protein